MNGVALCMNDNCSKSTCEEFLPGKQDSGAAADVNAEIAAAAVDGVQQLDAAAGCKDGETLEVDKDGFTTCSACNVITLTFLSLYVCMMLV